MQCNAHKQQRAEQFSQVNAFITNARLCMQGWKVHEVHRFVKIVVYRKDRELAINRSNAEEIDVQGKPSKYGRDAAVSMLSGRERERKGERDQNRSRSRTNATRC